MRRIRVALTAARWQCPAMTHAPRQAIDLTSGLLLLMLATVWGGSFFLAAIALREVPPLTVTLHRVVWAVPVLYAVLRMHGIALPRSPRVWLAFLVMGALNNALPFSLIFWGQQTVGSGLASILNGTTAILGAVVAGALLPDEPLTARKIGGAVAGLAGVAVIIGPGTLTGLDPRNLAQLAILGAALSYSVAGVWGRRMLGGNPPLLNAFGMVAGSALIMIPVAVAVDGVPSIRISLAGWLSLLMLSVACTALAYLLYFRILARAGAANLMLVTLMIPAVAVSLGHLFLGERLAPSAWIGFGLIASGLAITDGRPAAWLRARRAGGPHRQRF